LLDAKVEWLNDCVFCEKVVMEILKDATILTHVMSTKKTRHFRIRLLFCSLSWARTKDPLINSVKRDVS